MKFLRVSPLGAPPNMLDEAGWQDLVRRLARETNPKIRIMLLAQMEKAARDEQEHLKAQLQERINSLPVARL